MDYYRNYQSRKSPQHYLLVQGQRPTVLTQSQHHNPHIVVADHNLLSVAVSGQNLCTVANLVWVFEPSDSMGFLDKSGP